jgi:hypothetical protein
MSAIPIGNVTAMQRVPHVWVQLPTPRAPGNGAAVTPAERGSWDELYVATPRAIFLWQLARESLDEIVGLRHQRAQGEDESWRGPAIAERRLLRHVDAILAGGAEVIERLAREDAVDPADPDAVFAKVLVLSCAPGDPARAGLIALVHAAAEAGEESLAAAREALCLAPPEAAVPVAVQLGAETRTALMALALNVIASHGHYARDLAAGGSLSPDPGVRAGAANALGVIGEVSALLRLADDPDEEVSRTALRELTRLGVDGRESGLRERCVSGRATRADAAHWLGMLGHQRDFELFRELLGQSPPHPAVIRGAACFGHPGLLTDLAECLARAAPELAPIAATALMRMTGAPVVDVVPVFPEDAAAATPPSDSPPQLEEFEDVLPPEDERKYVEPAEPPVTPATLEVPSRDAARWQAWLETQSGLGARVRMFGGQVYSAARLLDALDRSNALPDQRAEWVVELASATAAGTRLDPRDWVARQEGQLATWHERIGSSAGALRDDGWRRD